MNHKVTAGDADSRAGEYARKEGIEVAGILGFGLDGKVFKTSRQSALKVFDRNNGYANELTVYQRLSQDDVHEICGHAVPQLWLYDNSLRIIEMSIVQPPFLLDFAKVTIDVPPDFTEDAIEMWRESKMGDFGDRWSDVEEIIGVLEHKYGIYLLDINPGNIKFAENEM